MSNLGYCLAQALASTEWWSVWLPGVSTAWGRLRVSSCPEPYATISACNTYNTEILSALPSHFPGGFPRYTARLQKELISAVMLTLLCLVSRG